VAWELPETGPRVGEAAALRWANVSDGDLVVGESKTEAGTLRTLPLSTRLERELWEHANLYSRVIKPAARRAGLAWVSWHALRHTCATLLIAEHALNPAELQAWLGHTDAAFSLSVYTHLTGRDLLRVEWARTSVHDGSNVHDTSTTTATPAASA
jgi:integrase